MTKQFLFDSERLLSPAVRQSSDEARLNMSTDATSLDGRDIWLEAIDHALASLLLTTPHRDQPPFGQTTHASSVQTTLATIDAALDSFLGSSSWYPTDRQVRTALAMCLAADQDMTEDQLALLRLGALLADLSPLPAHIAAQVPALTALHNAFQAGWHGIQLTTEAGDAQPESADLLAKVRAIGETLTQSPWLSTAPRNWGTELMTMGASW